MAARPARASPGLDIDRLLNPEYLCACISGGSVFGAAVGSALSSDDLLCASEDDVLAAVAGVIACLEPEFLPAEMQERLWHAVRFAFLSPAAWEALERAMGVLPPSLLATVQQHSALRSEWLAMHDPRLLRPGFWSLVRGATPAGINPRNCYAFSVNARGERLPGGLFFIWLDPRAPLAPAAADHPLPPRYAANVEGWGRAYGQDPLVLDGAQCALAVREASALLRAEHPHTRCELWSTYCGLANAGVDAQLGAPVRWIECADIARLAVLWLLGRGTTYLDTDMSCAMTPPIAAGAAARGPPVDLDCVAPAAPGRHEAPAFPTDVTPTPLVPSAACLPPAAELVPSAACSPPAAELVPSAACSPPAAEADEAGAAPSLPLPTGTSTAPSVAGGTVNAAGLQGRECRDLASLTVTGAARPDTGGREFPSMRSEPLPVAFEVAAPVAAAGAASCVAAVTDSDAAACAQPLPAVVGPLLLHEPHAAGAAGPAPSLSLAQSPLEARQPGKGAPSVAGVAPPQRAVEPVLLPAPLWRIDDAEEGGGQPLGPLLVLPQDEDGCLQNCFLAAAGPPRHPFLTLILLSVAAGARAESHVVHATGPALISALFFALQASAERDREGEGEKGGSDMDSAGADGGGGVGAAALSHRMAGASAVDTAEDAGRDAGAAGPQPPSREPYRYWCCRYCRRKLKGNASGGHRTAADAGDIASLEDNALSLLLRALPRAKEPELARAFLDAQDTAPALPSAGDECADARRPPAPRKREGAPCACEAGGAAPLDAAPDLLRSVRVLPAHSFFPSHWRLREGAAGQGMQRVDGVAEGAAERTAKDGTSSATPRGLETLSAVVLASSGTEPPRGHPGPAGTKHSAASAPPASSAAAEPAVAGAHVTLCADASASGVTGDAVCAGAEGGAVRAVPAGFLQAEAPVRPPDECSELPAGMPAQRGGSATSVSRHARLVDSSSSARGASSASLRDAAGSGGEAGGRLGLRPAVDASHRVTPAVAFPATPERPASLRPAHSLAPPPRQLFGIHAWDATWAQRPVAARRQDAAFRGGVASTGLVYVPYVPTRSSSAYGRYSGGYRAARGGSGDRASEHVGSAASSASEVVVVLRDVEPYLLPLVVETGGEGSESVAHAAPGAPPLLDAGAVPRRWTHRGRSSARPHALAMPGFLERRNEEGEEEGLGVVPAGGGGGSGDAQAAAGDVAASLMGASSARAGGLQCDSQGPSEQPGDCDEGQAPAAGDADWEPPDEWDERDVLGAVPLAVRVARRLVDAGVPLPVGTLLHRWGLAVPAGAEDESPPAPTSRD